MASTARNAAVSQRRLAPEMNSAPKTMAPNTSEVPRSGWMSTSASIGSAMRPAPMIVLGRSMDIRTRGQVVGQHDGQQDLGDLGELELQPQDGDPAGHAADAAADGEGRHQQQPMAKP